MADTPHVARNGDHQGWTLPTIHELLIRMTGNILDLLAANDKRYEERYEQSQVALGAALLAQEKAVAAALAAADRAVAKAEAAADKRFDTVNEFRAALSDLSATMLTRREYEAAHITLVEKVTGLEKRFEEIGRASCRERV